MAREQKKYLLEESDFRPSEQPENLSRRRFLQSAGLVAGAFVLGVGLPISQSRAQQPDPVFPPGTKVPAFLEIRPDNTISFLSPFVEGGQGIFTAMAQIVGEELDADPATFIVSNAPADAQYKVMNNGMRITGGSQSVKTSYMTMRRLGAIARHMLLQAAAEKWQVPLTSLRTEPGKVVESQSGKALRYGELASALRDLPVPDIKQIRLKDPKDFRWIKQPIKRLDIYEKSVGKALYTIDISVDDMLQAAVKHAPRLGLEVGEIYNQTAVAAMKGVHSIHRMDGAVAVVAQRWWHAKRAVEALQVEWKEPATRPSYYMPTDFSSEDYIEELIAQKGTGQTAEQRGDISAFIGAKKAVIEATYHSQYVNHAQLEPPSAIARFNPNGTLELWLPNQAPEMFQADVAKRIGLSPENIIIHSPLLGGFFGRHFLYEHAVVYPQAIFLAKAVGRPVKVIWSREEEFLRDTHRPMAAVHFRAAVDTQGYPVALEAVSVCEGPTEGMAGKQGDALDPTALEGITNKSYQIDNIRIAQLYHKGPVQVGYWRSVGNSMNDFLYETFLDEIAQTSQKDPYEMRLHLLRDNPRLTTLLNTVVKSSGGWQPGPYVAEDGSRRARGIAMASPFGTEAAAIAEVSISQGVVKVHHIWQAIDPGSIVNPAIIEAQVNGATALGLSQVLVEQKVYQDGQPLARNYDLYPILTPAQMAKVTVSIVESGAEMGGIGEPPLPAVPPAVANAVAQLTGKRIRSMPLSRHDLTS